MEKIAILGFGKLGRCLADVLSKENYQVVGWDVMETGDPRQVKSLTEVLNETTAIFLALPSEHFKKGLESLGPLDPSTLLVTFTKGFVASGDTLPYELVRRIYLTNPTAVVSGPMLSEELSMGLPTRAVVAADDDDASEKIKELFSGTVLTLEISDDWIGVSLLGILKNVYALVLGLGEGLSFGSNFKSVLTLMALREMENIVKEKGGQPETVYTPAGISDFLTTAYSPQSRNFTYGFRFARGEDLTGIMAEGIVNLEQTVRYVGDLASYPLLGTIKDIFSEDRPAKGSLVRLITGVDRF